MMLMAMRLDKVQVPSVVRFDMPGSNAFLRNTAVVAGYTDYEVLVIGAVGGRSGNTTVAPVRSGSGGGGGSSKRITGKLIDLAASTAVTVGLQGSTGANGNPSGAGGRGGNSTFGALATGYGGYGAYGAHTPNTANKGGEGANPDGSKGPLGGREAVDYAASGSWNFSTNEGQGGGGGSGNGQLAGPESGGGGAQGGSPGPHGFLPYGAPSGAVQSGLYGGDGGGANAGGLTGVDEEYYGGPRFGSLYGTGNGAVIVKLS